MFLIAGLQPKTKRMGDTPQRCPACGLVQAYLTRIDHYLSLFFIPLIPVKQGEPFLMCDHCQQPVDESRASAPTPPSSGSTVACVACREPVDQSHRYCPHCGQRRH